MRETLDIYIGYDPRESVAYHVFCNSVLANTLQPVAFRPLHGPQLQFDGQRDGTNAFIYSRFLVPALQKFQGWALFVDGDMLALDDLAGLFAHKDESKAVMVVKHDYKTKHPRKYLGTRMEADNLDYPRKNWSSVMLWNCGHPSNRILTQDFVENATGAQLHRFGWLRDEEVGELPQGWNLLVGEQRHPHPSLVHYTLGIPAFKAYEDCDWGEEWLLEYNCMRLPFSYG